MLKKFKTDIFDTLFHRVFLLSSTIVRTEMEVYEASSMSKALSETSKGLRCYSSIIFRFIFDMSFFQEASIHLTKALSFRILHLINLRLSNLGLCITKLVICFSLLLALLDNHVTL